VGMGRKVAEWRPMLDRIGGWLAGIGRGLWRATFGRLFGKPEPIPPPRLVVREPDEPRSVAGITLRATLVVVGVVLAFYLAYQLRQLLILSFLAVLFAAGLFGPAAWLERRGLPRVPSVVLTYLALVAVLALVIFAIFPPLVGQAVQLVDQLPDLFERLRQSSIDLIDQFAGAGTTEQVIDTITQGAQDALPGLSSLLQVPLTVLGIVVNVLLIFFLSALLLLERDAIRAWAVQFIAPDDRGAVELVVERATAKLGAYVRGQLVLMTAIGIGAGLGMLLIGLFTTGEPLPFLFPMSLLAFITEAIPMVGPVIGGAPIVLIALLVDPFAGVLMAAWLVALQQLEGLVLVPVIQGRAVQLSPIVVLLAVLAGASLGGIVGAIIAIPVVAVVDVVLRDVVLPLRRRAEERRRGTALPAP
jgi:predicted PurR-regulated permease PerM